MKTYATYANLNELYLTDDELATVESVWHTCLAQLKDGSTEIVFDFTAAQKLSPEGVEMIADRFSDRINSVCFITHDTMIDAVRMASKEATCVLTKRFVAYSIKDPTALPRPLLRYVKPRNPRHKVAQHLAESAPRPVNCFIMYRQAQHVKLKENGSTLHNSEISKMIGEQWANEPKTVRSYWEAKATDYKERHARIYPGYEYKPRKPTEKKHRVTKTPHKPSNRSRRAAAGEPLMTTDEHIPNFAMGDDPNFFIWEPVNGQKGLFPQMSAKHKRQFEGLIDPNQPSSVSLLGDSGDAIYANKVHRADLHRSLAPNNSLTQFAFAHTNPMAILNASSAAPEGYTPAFNHADFLSHAQVQSEASRMTEQQTYTDAQAGVEQNNAGRYLDLDPMNPALRRYIVMRANRGADRRRQRNHDRNRVARVPRPQGGQSEHARPQGGQSAQKKAVNAYMAFRSYYSDMLKSALVKTQQKEKSGEISKLFNSEPRRATWEAIAKAYTSLRDARDPAMQVVMKEYLAVVCPHLNIIGPEQYLQAMNWQVRPGVNGRYLERGHISVNSNTSTPYQFLHINDINQHWHRHEAGTNSPPPASINPHNVASDATQDVTESDENVPYYESNVQDIEPLSEAQIAEYNAAYLGTIDEAPAQFEALFYHSIDASKPPFLGHTELDASRAPLEAMTSTFWTQSGADEEFSPGMDPANIFDPLDLDRSLAFNIHGFEFQGNPTDPQFGRM